jgi:hypothetical protein
MVAALVFVGVLSTITNFPAPKAALIHCAMDGTDLSVQVTPSGDVEASLLLIAKKELLP